jgi:hypothetical protein
MEKYHQAAIFNGPMSTTLGESGIPIHGFHVHPKAKSNDMMGG